MDVLSDICRSLRLAGSIFYFADLSAPWGITLPAAQEPRFHVVLDGRLWYQTDKMQHPTTMEAGDILVIPEGGWHWVADDPGSNRELSSVVAEAKDRGQPLFQGETLATRLLCGLFRFDTTLGHPLMSTLPPCLHLKDNRSMAYTWLKQTAAWMYDELTQQDTGTDVLVDRLCEVFFIQVLRGYQQFQTGPPGFLAALYDVRIHEALTLMHAHLEADWTLEKMARTIGMSRAAFADRFTHLVGQSFRAYLTAWRMRKALNLLQSPDATVSRIAAAVGYSSDVAFSRTFRRFLGMSPQAYRKGLEA